MTRRPHMYGHQVATAIDVDSIDPAMNDASSEARQAITSGCSSALARRRVCRRAAKTATAAAGSGSVAANPGWLIERRTGTVDPVSK